MTTCDNQRVPRPATGKTPVRNVRIPDEDWFPLVAKAEMEGRTASDALAESARRYVADAAATGYEFTYANWPDAGAWAPAHFTALTALGEELNAATGFLPLQWLAIAAWLGTTHHEGDPAQQKRVITGHILRRAQAAEHAPGGWRDRYRDSRHLSETVQAILERHLPLAPDA